ncbi:MAG: class I SAM-dependent methyltransferase [Pseudomonadota bacterium]
MSGFSADWLALRKDADDRARSRDVLARAVRHVADAQAEIGRSNDIDKSGREGNADIRFCDLGSGTGASVAAFVPHFTEVIHAPQSWTLCDIDADNLATARARYADVDDISVTTRMHDLSRDPAPFQSVDAPAADIVTATALFDLVSAKWIDRFVGALAEARLPLLATLTYDGRHMFDPPHPLDAMMHTAFDAHQQTEKGFGPALGPAAVSTLVATLEEAGFTVRRGDSPWMLERDRDAALVAALVEGWANAVSEAGLVEPADAAVWCSARIGDTRSLLVGHTDIFAAPPPT